MFHKRIDYSPRPFSSSNFILKTIIFEGVAEKTDPGSQGPCSDDSCTTWYKTIQFVCGHRYDRPGLKKNLFRRSSLKHIIWKLCRDLEQKSFIVYCERIDYSPRPFSSSNFILKIIILEGGAEKTDPGSQRPCSDDSCTTWYKTIQFVCGHRYDRPGLKKNLFRRSSLKHIIWKLCRDLEQKSFIVYCERIDYSPRPFSSSNFILKTIIFEGVAEKTDPGSQRPCFDDSCTTWYKTIQFVCGHRTDLYNRPGFTKNLFRRYSLKHIYMKTLQGPWEKVLRSILQAYWLFLKAIQFSRFHPQNYHFSRRHRKDRPGITKTLFRRFMHHLINNQPINFYEKEKRQTRAHKEPARTMFTQELYAKIFLRPWAKVITWVFKNLFITWC